MKDVYYIREGDIIRASAYLYPDALEDQAGRNTWVLSRIQVMRGTNKGEGWGTKLLCMVIEAADAEGANLMLGVFPDMPGYFRRLVGWYTRHGFRPYKRRTVGLVHNLMMRWAGK